MAFEALGRYAVPGPWVESAAYLPVLLGREIDDVATVAVPPHVPFALDADVADTVHRRGRRLGDVGGGRTDAPVGRPDPTTVRRDAGRVVSTTGASAPSSTTDSFENAFDLAVLATSAQLLGLGEHLLDASVAYVKQRRQFGREIGSYQAIKHRLADVRIALDFARPLVFGAALDEVPASAAKVACGDAAYLAARTALQVHGAVGYTQRARPQPLDHEGSRAGHRLGHSRPSTAPGSWRVSPDGGRTHRGAAGARGHASFSARQAGGQRRRAGRDGERVRVRRGALDDADRADRRGRACRCPRSTTASARP